MRFAGLYHHSLEEKSRTSLPARWRQALAGASEDRSLWMTQGPEGGLWVFPHSGWMRFQEGLAQRVRSLPALAPEARMLTHFFVSPAQEVSLDKLGRVLVPPTLREFAGLDEQVVWVGALEMLELWSQERWQQRCAQLTDAVQSGTLREAAEKIGLTLGG